MPRYIIYGDPDRLRDALSEGPIEVVLPFSHTFIAYGNTPSLKNTASLAFDEVPWLPAATGPTTRLQSYCSVCRDELPLGAKFCITCGEPTA